MKYLIAAVLLSGVCSGASVGRRRSPDLEQSGGFMDGRDEHLQRCVGAFQTCAKELMLFSQRDESLIYADLRQEGLQNICPQSLKAMQCSFEASDTLGCSEFMLTQETRKMFTDSYNFLCVQQFDAIQRNVRCLFDNSLQEELNRCTPGYNDRCNSSRIIACVERVIDNAGDVCQPEAKQVAKDVITFAINAQPYCR